MVVHTVLMSLFRRMNVLMINLSDIDIIFQRMNVLPVLKLDSVQNVNMYKLTSIKFTN